MGKIVGKNGRKKIHRGDDPATSAGYKGGGG